jgi:2-keto-4-pentenoate hydratase
LYGSVDKIDLFCPCMLAEKNTKIEESAKRLRDAATSGIPCNPVRELIGETDQVAAYAVQSINNNLKINAGARVIGKKIGLTSFVVQKQLGVDQPDFGLLLNHMQIENDGIVPWNECMQPKAEAEVAFVMSYGIENENANEQDILDATEYICASIEVVGSRILNWDIRITDTIADNAAASHLVLGDSMVYPQGFDFTGCKMQMLKNGEVCSEGKGEACLGSPVKAVLWLAKTMIKMGTPLQAGDIVLSGALGPMVAASPGDYFEATVDGLGTVGVHFGS